MLLDSLTSWQETNASVEPMELIVVDNASTDSTAQVVSRFDEARYVLEPQQGLSHARNRGIAEAKGELIAFVDDDIFFDKAWPTEICRAFDEYPQADCVGGQSQLHFESTQPEWLSTAAMPFYGSTESGHAAREMRYPEHPFGVNMAFRRHIFDEVGMFDPRLGRIKESLLSNEEKEFFYRVKQNENTVIYWPDAKVRHRITEERTSRKWVLSRAYWQGISGAVFEQMTNRPSRSTLVLAALQATRTALHSQKQLFKLLFAAAGSNREQEKVNQQIQFRHQLGTLKQNLASIFSVP